MGTMLSFNSCELSRPPAGKNDLGLLLVVLHRRPLRTDLSSAQIRNWRGEAIPIGIAIAGQAYLPLVVPALSSGGINSQALTRSSLGYSFIVCFSRASSQLGR